MYDYKYYTEDQKKLSENNLKENFPAVLTLYLQAPLEII